MATFTGWYYTGDQPTQEFTFEADKSLKGDIEELETVKELDRYEDYEAVVDSGTIFFYDDDKLAEVFNAGEALRSAVEQIESSGNDEAEIRYDGLKYFIVNAIY